MLPCISRRAHWVKQTTLYCRRRQGCSRRNPIGKEPHISATKIVPAGKKYFVHSFFRHRTSKPPLWVDVTPTSGHLPSDSRHSSKKKKEVPLDHSRS